MISHLVHASHVLHWKRHDDGQQTALKHQTIMREGYVKTGARFQCQRHVFVSNLTTCTDSLNGSLLAYLLQEGTIDRLTVPASFQEHLIKYWSNRWDESMLFRHQEHR